MHFCPSRACFVFTLAIITGDACSQDTAASAMAWCANAVPALRKTLSVPPKEQAKAAASTGDLRYLEWYGFYSFIPGVRSQQCAREGRITKPFEGTSDALCSPEHSRLYDQSYAYAEAYNQQLANERRSRGQATCSDA
jgi:hypothetical protein